MKRRSDVLVYSQAPASRATVRNHYRRWRRDQAPPLPGRCDNVHCFFHTNALSWNGAELPLILDHINGNNSDNRSRNLRFLCPNCDSQLPTRGGGNRGCVEKSLAGFAIINKETARREFSLFAEQTNYASGIAPNDHEERNGISLTDCGFDNPVIVSDGTIIVDGSKYSVPPNASHQQGCDTVGVTLFEKNE